MTSRGRIRWSSAGWRPARSHSPHKKAKAVSANRLVSSPRPVSSPKMGPCPPLGMIQRHDIGSAVCISSGMLTGYNGSRSPMDNECTGGDR